MEDIEELLEILRVVYVGMERLKQMSGPEMLLPGRVESYQATLAETTAAYHLVRARVEDLGEHLEAERGRLDQGVKQYGPTQRERRGE